MIDKIRNYHKSLIKIAWANRHDPDYRIEIKRSIHILRKVCDSGCIQVFGSAMGKIR